MELINRELLSKEDEKILFEQYKIYIEMTDRVSQRRMNVNTFFISANTLLFTIVSLTKKSTDIWSIFVSILGSVLCVMWYFTLNSYKQLNMGKFKVIYEIEKLLPLSVYAYEWELLEKGKKIRKYWTLSHIEKVIPIIFCALYIIFTTYYVSQTFHI